ncbi:hypothetical protein KAR10_09120, partial [bacterium]|nr:hypothetical protein [bacterium]
KYDLNSHVRANALFIEPLGKLNASGCNAAAFWCRSESKKNVSLSFRLRITDANHSRTIGFVEEVGAKWKEIVFPFENFRGILANTSDLKTLEIRFERAPVEFPGRPVTITSGIIFLDDIRLVHLDADELKNRVRDLLNLKRLVLGTDGEMRGLTRMAGWQSFHDADATQDFRINSEENILGLIYDFGHKGKWVTWEKSFSADLSKDFEITFDIKGSGNNTLEIKLFSTGGAVFGKHLTRHTAFSKWRQISLSRGDIEYLWGGKPGDKLGPVKMFGLAISGGPGTKGRVEIRDLKLKIRD